MMNNNHKNSGCGFAEQLVSHLYGEADAVEKAAFEAHLASCSGCADELAAFAGVHFSINDWKQREFAALETPVIEIPYEKTPNGQPVSEVKGSWLSALRDLFSLSPRGLSLAAASAAVFAVTVGLALFVLNSKNDNDIAGTNKNSKAVVTTPTVENTPVPANVNGNQTGSPDKESKPLTVPKAPLPELAVEPNPKNNRAVKTATNPRPAQKADNPNTPKNNNVKRNNKNNNETAPPVIPDEDEDDSLRLAELFEEIDTRE
jgi:hypothetical protein